MRHGSVLRSAEHHPAHGRAGHHRRTHRPQPAGRGVSRHRGGRSAVLPTRRGWKVAMTSLRAINDLSRHNGAIAEDLKAAVSRVFDSGWYILGNEVAAFERAFAQYCGVSFAVGVGNGTDALELALAAVGVGRDDKVALAANAGGYGTTAVNAIGA